MRLIPISTLLIILSTAVAAGCSIASGSRGDAGEDAPGLVWKDATGAQVTGGEELLLVDAHGRQWVLDQETARPYLAAFDIYFDQAGCAGAAYAVTFLPRRVFRLAGETALRVRPDDLASVSVNLASRRTSEGTCSEYDIASQRMVPITEATLPDPPIEEPALAFAPPLRLEPR